MLCIVEAFTYLPQRGEYRRRLPYNKVGANVGEPRTNNRDKNQNWMVFRMEVSGANTNNRNSVA